MPRLRRLERLRFGSLAGPRVGAPARRDHRRRRGRKTSSTTAERVRENWLSLGTLIDRSFE